MSRATYLGHMGVGRGSSRPTRKRAAGALSSEAVWKYLCGYMVEHKGRPPSVREIALAMGGRSLGSVSKALSGLHVQGKIRYNYGTHRHIEIVDAVYLLPPGALGEANDQKNSKNSI